MWELIFLMVILKIPIAYLCWVVYWAVKAKPEQQGGDGGLAAVPAGPAPQTPWLPRGRRPRPVRPHAGGPSRRYARTGRVARVYGRR